MNSEKISEQLPQKNPEEIQPKELDLARVILSADEDRKALGLSNNAGNEEVAKTRTAAWHEYQKILGFSEDSMNNGLVEVGKSDLEEAKSSVRLFNSSSDKNLADDRTITNERFDREALGLDVNASKEDLAKARNLAWEKTKKAYGFSDEIIDDKPKSPSRKNPLDKRY
jgi:hypothetical protein